MSTQPQGNPNDLTVTDLAAMKSIIELASERAAFKPSEMAAVGTVYNKLELFLKAVEDQQKAAAAAAKSADQGSTENKENTDA
jgi:hypothetical protein